MELTADPRCHLTVIWRPTRATDTADPIVGESGRSVSAGINGFGRMGRLGLRAAWGWEDVEFVPVNEIAGDAACAAHLREFDSELGRFAEPCAAVDGPIQVGDRRSLFDRQATIEDDNWSGCDLVIEASGVFLKPEQLVAYIEQGIRKVVAAAPVAGALNIVMGVNDARYEPDEHHLVTAASCTTNCLAPIVKVMHERLGARHHRYLPGVDGPPQRSRGARATFERIASQRAYSERH